MLKKFRIKSGDSRDALKSIRKGGEEQMKKKHLTILVALTIFAIAGCAPGCGTPDVWLDTPEKAETWVTYEVYEVKEEGGEGEYRLRLDLPKEAELYLARFSHYGNLEKASHLPLWVGPVESRGDIYANKQWDGLLAFPHEFNIELLQHKEHQPHPSWIESLGQKQAAFFYVCNGEEWWAFWAPSFNELNILRKGRLEAAVSIAISK